MRASSGYANPGYFTPVFHHSSDFFSIAPMPFLVAHVSMPISLNATVHQYVAYGMSVKCHGINADHLSKQVVLPQG